MDVPDWRSLTLRSHELLHLLRRYGEHVLDLDSGASLDSFVCLLLIHERVDLDRLELTLVSLLQHLGEFDCLRPCEGSGHLARVLSVELCSDLNNVFDYLPQCHVVVLLFHSLLLDLI